MQGDIFPTPPRDAPIGAVERWVHDQNGWPAMGVDEAGRGPLAGPVFAAAVVLPPGPLPSELTQLNDSKKLSASVRALLEGPIRSFATAIGIAWAEADEVDEVNILEATRNAMRRAIAIASEALGRAPSMLLVDGNLAIPAYRGDQWPLVSGDARSLNIAAASILAKVSRDRVMVELDRKYPGYGFARHKGYGTRAHREALKKLGPCAVHRRSFRWGASSE